MCGRCWTMENGGIDKVESADKIKIALLASMLASDALQFLKFNDKRLMLMALRQLQRDYNQLAEAIEKADA